MKTELLALIENYGKALVYQTEGKISAFKDAKNLMSNIVFLLDKAEQEQAPAAVAMPDAISSLTGDTALAHEQCRAVVHLALAVAEVYSSNALIVANDARLADQIGAASAEVMEYLGDTLNSTDATTEEDEWLEPIFEAAQERWPAAAQAAPADALDRTALTDLIAEHLSGTYHCTRVWNAWNVGTMSQNDFEAVDESDTPGEISDSIIAKFEAKRVLRAAPVAVEPTSSQRDELLQVALDFIGTLTGMEPPPVEVAPPEVFAPFYDFVDRVQAITSPRAVQADPTRSDRTWCEYIAGMIGTYLSDLDDKKIAAIAGIIERRLCFLPVPKASPAWSAKAPVAVEPVAHLEVNRILSIADVHAFESREDGVRLIDMGGLVAFACDVLRAATPAAPADALTHTELLEIRRAADDFKNHGETDVDDDLLIRGAQAGYLECTHFQMLDESALDLDIQAALKNGGT